MLVFTLFGQLDTGTATRKKKLVYYLLTFTIYSLKPLDIEIMKRLGSRVNLIPVIAKADTLTPTDLKKFKDNV
jgi:cell division control protein 12